MKSHSYFRIYSMDELGEDHSTLKLIEPKVREESNMTYNLMRNKHVIFHDLFLKESMLNYILIIFSSKRNKI